MILRIIILGLIGVVMASCLPVAETVPGTPRRSILPIMSVPHATADVEHELGAVAVLGVLASTLSFVAMIVLPFGHKIAGMMALASLAVVAASLFIQSMLPFLPIAYLAAGVATAAYFWRKYHPPAPPA